jgi:hypothetical protein
MHTYQSLTSALSFFKLLLHFHEFLLVPVRLGLFLLCSHSDVDLQHFLGSSSVRTNYTRAQSHAHSSHPHL